MVRVHTWYGGIRRVRIYCEEVISVRIAIVNELMGKKYTQGVMLDLEYDPHPPYNGGSVKKTIPIVADMMKEMYDMALLPLIK
jgi:hypothetical protein